MPAPPIVQNAAGIDLSPRWFNSTTVVASPSAATETTICSLTINQSVAVQSGVYLSGMAAFTVGTSGTAVTLKLRQTNTSGTTVFSSGALTATAGNLYCIDVQGIDTAAVVPGQVYVLTMTVTSGAATSTVSATNLLAVVV